MKPLFRDVIDEVEALLDYRLPDSKKPLGHIVLTRDQAERLVHEVCDLRIRAREVEG